MSLRKKVNILINNNKLRNRLRYAVNFILTFGAGKNLNKLAIINKTDKWGIHSYTKHYRYYFNKLRKKKINLLEIGVGGYDSPQNGGASLRMWKRYFLRGNIYSLDIYDKSLLEEDRIKFLREVKPMKRF
ncbi:MAG: hypothetical protein QM751_01250 [Paludibacteraceae bacterium]